MNLHSGPRGLNMGVSTPPSTACERGLACADRFEHGGCSYAVDEGWFPLSKDRLPCLPFLTLSFQSPTPKVSCFGRWRTCISALSQQVLCSAGCLVLCIEFPLRSSHHSRFTAGKACVPESCALRPVCFYVPINFSKATRFVYVFINYCYKLFPQLNFSSNSIQRQDSIALIHHGYLQ